MAERPDAAFSTEARRAELLSSAFSDGDFTTRWEQQVGGGSKYASWLVSTPLPDGGGVLYEVPTHLIFDALSSSIQGS